MKKSKVFLFTVLFAFLGTSFLMANTPIEDNPSEIRKELMSYVGDIDLTDMETEEAKVSVQFLINAKSEVVVIYVNNSEFETLIENKLNYRTIKTNDVVRNKIYTLPVVFKKK